MLYQRPACSLRSLRFSLPGMGKNSNVRKRKTFHDADIAAEKEQDAKREEKRKKKQAKLLAKVLTGPAVVPTPMDEERTGTKGAARSKQPLRAKGLLQGVKKKKTKETKIHKRQLIRAVKGKVRAAEPCPSGRRCQAIGPAAPSLTCAKPRARQEMEL